MAQILGYTFQEGAPVEEEKKKGGQSPLPFTSIAKKQPTSGTPLTPWGPVVSGTAGDVLRGFARGPYSMGLGEGLYGMAEGSPFQDIYLPPPETTAGKVAELAGGIGAAAGTGGFAMARGAASLARGAGGYIEPILESARRHPALTQISETAAGMLGGAARGVSEATVPQDKWYSETVNLLAETAGGMPGSTLGMIGKFTPTGWAARHVGKQFPPGEQMKAAVKALDDYLGRTSGQTLGDVAGKVAGEPGGYGQSIGQVARSRELIAIQRGLETSPDYRLRGRKAAESQQAQIREHLTEAFGAPAQEDKDILFRNMLHEMETFKKGMEADAQRIADEALQAASKLPQGDTLALSQETRRLLGESLAQWRGLEDRIWSAVPRNVPIAGERVDDLMTFYRSMVLDTEQPDVPGEIGVLLRQWAAKIERNQPITSGDVMTLRSKALEIQRGSPVGSRMSSASGRIAGEAMDALESIENPDFHRAYALGRKFTTDLHDTFYRDTTPIAKVFRGTVEHQRDPQEFTASLMLGRQLKGDADKVAVNIRAMRFAAREAIDPRDPTAPTGVERIEQLNANIRRYLTSEVARSGVVKPDGTVDVPSLQRYMKRNAAVLSEVPELRADLQAVNDIYVRLESDTAKMERAREFIERSLVGEVVRHDLPQIAVDFWSLKPSGRFPEGRDTWTKQALTIARRLDGGESGRREAGLKRVLLESLLDNLSTQERATTGEAMLSGDHLARWLDSAENRRALEMLSAGSPERMKALATALQNLGIREAPGEELAPKGLKGTLVALRILAAKGVNAVLGKTLGVDMGASVQTAAIASNTAKELGEKYGMRYFREFVYRMLTDERFFTEAANASPAQLEEMGRAVAATVTRPGSLSALGEMARLKRPYLFTLDFMRRSMEEVKQMIEDRESYAPDPPPAPPSDFGMTTRG